jgi:hypothetical protein
MNLTETNQFIPGVAAGGILYGQFARVDELNDRISARLKCDTPLQPNLEFRAVPTKYATFPIIDRVAQRKEPLRSYLEETGFAPTQSTGPVAGFVSNINVESSLRNQYFALQSAPQAAYIPSSTSDLYNASVPTATTRQEQQPYPLLFDSYKINMFAPVRNANPAVGSDVFLNHTRTQLRGNGQ